MALVYRAHFAFMVRPIMTSQGLNTSAVYGFANTLIELLKNERPTHLAVIFDTAAPTARHVAFPAYKAQRELMPEDLSRALPYVKRLIEAFNISVISLDGYEADDIIGTLARQAEALGDYATYMVTPDKDFAQLVDERTFIYKPGRQGSEHEIIDVAKVREYWLVADPIQVIDVLALWGDVSDNIPGVPGIGEKTAKALIQKYGTVENILANTDQLKGKQKENVEGFREGLALSKRLTTIDTAVPITQTVESLLLQPLDEAAVQAMLVELEFNQLGRRLFGGEFKAGRGHREEGAAPEAIPAGVAVLKCLTDTPHDYREISLADGEISLPPCAALALDVDHTTSRPSRLRGVGLAWEAGRAAYVNCEQGLPTELRQWLENADVTKLGYDAKSQFSHLLWLNLQPAGPWHDLLLAQAIAEPEQRATLGYLAEAHLGYTLTAPATTTATGDLLDLETSPETTARQERVMEQADLVWQLHPRLLERVEQTNQQRVYHEIELPLMPILATMEHTGIKIDPVALAELGEKLSAQISLLETSIQALAGQNFNLNSPKQLGQILFEQMKLMAKPKKTKTGQYVTNEEVLQELVSAHPIVAQILEYREATKLKNTYVDALPYALHPITGRVHTTYHQASTATGRLASNHPNLQNIPIRSEQGREIRRGFVAGQPDWILISADYSQIELRVMASLSGDRAMQEAFVQQEDIHSATAARVFGVMPAFVDSEMRRTAKMVNFGIIYGISAFGLAQRLGQPRGECQRLIDEYFVQYPGVKNFMEQTIAQAQAQGYVETITGRRRYLRDINSANATVRKAAERTAINTPIQGTAADMIKLAMGATARALAASRFQARLLLQVHDELVLEAPATELAAVQALVQQAMQEALPLPGVPIQIDFGHGYDWKQAHA